MDWKAYGGILRDAAKDFMADGALRSSAALAYYSVFSLAPLLLIATAIAGTLFGEDAVQREIAWRLEDALGTAGANAVQDLLVHARQPGKNAVMTAVGVGMLLIGAGGVFGELQEALNQVWNVKRKPGGLMRMLRERFLSYAMVLGTGFLLLVSMLLTTWIEAVGVRVGSMAEVPAGWWQGLSAVGSFVVVVVLFAAIFKVLPDVDVWWRDVWAGACFTAVLFVVGKTVLGWYLGRQALSSGYGPAGSLVLVLLWVHYSAVIVLYGAECTQARAVRHGRGGDG